MANHPYRDKKGRLLPGHPGKAPGGDPGARERKRLTDDLCRRLRADFAKHGIAAIEKARNESPLGYLQVITKLVPKEHKVLLEHDYYGLLLRAMEMVEQAEVGPDGRKQLAHLGADETTRELRGTTIDVEAERVTVGDAETASTTAQYDAKARARVARARRS